MKPEQWGSPLVQEKYQEEKPVTRDIHVCSNNNNNNNKVNISPLKPRSKKFDDDDNDDDDNNNNNNIQFIHNDIYINQVF